MNPFRNETRPQILSVPTEGGTPNAVIQNPIRSIINPSSSNQSQAILDRYDIEGRPFGKGEVDSDEEDSRPFKENSLKHHLVMKISNVRSVIFNYITVP